MDRVIDIVNQGAKFIDDGDFSKAIVSLATVLKDGGEGASNEQADDCSDPKSCSSIPTSPCHTPSPDQSLCSIDQCMKMISRSKSFEDSDDDTTTPFLYQKPIYISSSNLPRKEKTAVRLVALFNLALARHLKAITTPPDQSAKKKRNFQLAVKIYELVFMLGMRDKPGVFSFSQGMAMLNNCAIIYKELRQEEKSDRRYQYLLTSIMMVVVNGNTEETDQFDGFISNASRLILQNTTAGAA
jgi:hypothetical protein